MAWNRHRRGDVDLLEPSGGGGGEGTAGAALAPDLRQGATAIESRTIMLPTPDAETPTYGSPTGTAVSSSTYSAVNQIITLNQTSRLRSLTFKAHAATTYTLSVDGVEIGSVTTAGVENAVLLCDAVLRKGDRAFTLSAVIESAVDYVPGLADLGTVGEYVSWDAFDTTYTVPWALQLEVASHASAWQSVVPLSVLTGPAGPAGSAGPAGAEGSIAESYRGVYDPAVSYADGDIVTFEGSLWLSEKTQTGTTPTDVVEPVVETFDTPGVLPDPPWTGFGWSHAPTAEGGTMYAGFAAGRVIGVESQDFDFSVKRISTTDSQWYLQWGEKTAKVDGNSWGFVGYYLSIGAGGGVSLFRTDGTNDGALLASTALGAAVPTTGTLVMRFTRTGNTFRCYVDGAQVLQYTDNTPLTVPDGVAGVRGPTTGSAGWRWDDFTYVPMVGTGWKKLAHAPGVARKTVTYTTAELASMAGESGTISMAPAYRLYSIETNVEARVRLYGTLAQRDADVARTVESGPPTGAHGLMFEFSTTPTMLSSPITPLVDGVSLESPPSSDIPIRVGNSNPNPVTVTVTLTYVRTE